MTDNKNAIVEIISKDSGILHLSLNRPEQLNALNDEMLKRMSQIFHEAKGDVAVKTILLTGAGKAFSAGADIKQLAALSGGEAMAFAQAGQAVFRQLELLGKPSLAAIHGYAFGGGCELAMAATMRIATRTALFGQPEIKLGVIPGFGGTKRLAQLVGKGRALELCLTGRRFSAEEAYRYGMVSELTEPENLLIRARAILSELAKLPPIAMESVITVIDQGFNLSFEEASLLEAAQFASCCKTADKQEGVNAFIEKRLPVFSGK